MGGTVQVGTSSPPFSPPLFSCSSCCIKSPPESLVFPKILPPPIHPHILEKPIFTFATRFWFCSCTSTSNRIYFCSLSSAKMEIAAVTFVVIMAFGAVGLVLGLVAAITWYLSRLYFATEESSSDEDIELGVVNDFLRGGNVYRSMSLPSLTRIDLDSSTVRPLILPLPIHDYKGAC